MADDSANPETVGSGGAVNEIPAVSRTSISPANRIIRIVLPAHLASVMGDR